MTNQVTTILEPRLPSSRSYREGIGGPQFMQIHTAGVSLVINAS